MAYAALRHFGAQCWFVGKYLLLAIMLGALLQSLVPGTAIRGLLGAHTWYAVPLAGLLGLATYGISSVPFAKVLLTMGASPGAVMAFFLAIVAVAASGVPSATPVLSTGFVNWPWHAGIAT